MRVAPSQVLIGRLLVVAVPTSMAITTTSRKESGESILPEERTTFDKFEEMIFESLVGLTRKKKEADILVTGTNKITQDVLTSCANSGKRVIESTIQNIIDLAGELHEKSETTPDYILAQIKKSLNKHHKAVV
jgi:hypothetical protein